MKRLVVIFLVGVLAVAVLCLGATETLVNRSGKTATGIVVTFSEAVRINSYDKAVFPSQEPSGRAKRFVFNGGSLANGGRFRVSWSPSTTDIESYEWLHDASSGPVAIALPSRPPAQVLGTCAYVDTTYGIPTIVVTSITTRDLREAGIRLGDEIAVTVGNSVLTMPLDYPPSCVPEGGCLAYLLWGDLRVYKRAGDFAATFGVSAGMPIQIRLIEEAKYARSAEVTDLDRYWSDHSVAETAQATQLALVAASLSPLHVSGSKILDAAGNTVVLRGVAVEDPYWARVGDTPVLKRDLLYLKALGANVIHIPVHPEAWKLVGGEGYAAGYLDDLVRWSGELGLYVAISWKAHGEPETKTINEERYDPDMVLALDALSLLAHRYANCPWVMYSVFNEPDAFTHWERFRLCMTDLVDAIRAQSPEAIVIVPGVDIATDLSAIPAAPIERENILYAADMYPWAWDKTPWREDAAALLAAGFPLIVFEWGFDVQRDEDRFAYCCQYSTPESFGEPIMAFCAENRISWTAWVWSADWCPHMFYDYERLRPTAFGQLVLAALRDGPLPAAAALPPAISVEPPGAAAAGCWAFDRLKGNYGSIPATIVQAEAAQGWAFDHWEGTLEGSSWLINSTLLGATVRAVFEPLFVDSDQLRATQASEGGQSTSGGGVRVLFDESHNERNTISPDRAAVLKAGHPEWVLYQDLTTELSTTYSIVRGTGPLASDALADVGVVVLAAPDGRFSPSERADLVSFVSAGKGLLLLADAFPSQALNDLATAFGVTFLPGVAVSHSGDWDPQSYWARDVSSNHPITQKVNEFHTNWGCAIDLRTPGAELIKSAEDTWLDEDGDGKQVSGERTGSLTLAAAVEYGAGRVVAIADNAFHDGMLGFPGNRELILESIRWLASGPSVARFSLQRDVTDRDQEEARATASLSVGADELWETKHRGVNINPSLALEGDIDILANDWNVNLVRLTLGIETWGWGPSCSTSGGWPSWCYSLDLGKLDLVLDWCEAYGVRAVIALFACEGYNSMATPADYRLWTSSSLQQRFVELWRSIAHRYANRGDVVYGYDFLNEPHTASGGVPQAWYDLSQRAASAIRQVDQRHAIILEYGYDKPIELSRVTPLEDPNVIYSIHVWDPNEFTHQAYKGNPSSLQYPSGAWNKDYMTEFIKPAVEFRRRFGGRIYVGEVGVYCSADSTSRCAYLRDCLDLFEDNGFDYTLWEYRTWPAASLEHVGYETPDKWIEEYVGETPVLQLFRGYLSRNGANPAAHASPNRPRCVFDKSHWGANRDRTVRATNLAGRLTALCDVVGHADGRLTKDVLEGAALLVTGDAFGVSYSQSEIAVIEEFVSSGGALLFYGANDWGLNALLSRFGIEIVPSRVVVPLNSPVLADDQASFFIRDFCGPQGIADGLVSFLVNSGASLEVTSPAIGVAYTPADAWRDANRDSAPDPGETRGPFPVIAVSEYGTGRVAVVSDDELRSCRTWPAYSALVNWLIAARP